MITINERYRAYGCDSCGAYCWRQSREAVLQGDCSGPLPSPHGSESTPICRGKLRLVAIPEPSPSDQSRLF